MIIEEYLLKDMDGQEPLYVMGWEGTWGLLFTFIFFTSVKLSSCPLSEKDCVAGHLDDLNLLKEQIANKPILITLALIFIGFCSLYNGSAIILTQHASAVNRSIADQIRVIVVWYFFMMYHGYGHESFSLMKLAGFLFVIFGVLWFNKVIDLTNTQPEVSALQQRDTATELEKVEKEKVDSNTRKETAFSLIDEEINGEEQDELLGDKKEV